MDDANAGCGFILSLRACLLRRAMAAMKPLNTLHQAGGEVFADRHGFHVVDTGATLHLIGGKCMTNSANSDQAFVRTAMKAPYLEREEEHGLAVRWKQYEDQAALNRIVQAHMRLVIAMAAKFRHYGLPMADLIQEGHVGLLEAAARFEPDRFCFGSRPMRPGGSALRSKTMFCAIGRSFVAALRQNRKPCFLIFGACGRNCRVGPRPCRPRISIVRSPRRLAPRSRMWR